MINKSGSCDGGKSGSSEKRDVSWPEGKGRLRRDKELGEEPSIRKAQWMQRPWGVGSRQTFTGVGHRLSIVLHWLLSGHRNVVNTKISWAWWRVPVIPATQKAKVEELPEPRRRRLR